MRKLFYLLAAAIVLMILTTAFGIYWLSQSDITKAREESAVAEAKNVALGLSAQIDLLNKTLDKMTQDPDVLNAVALGNNGLLKMAADKLEQYIPDILKIRILLPDTHETDDQAKPSMGFADLELVRETLNGNTFPGIQGEKGADRHFAIARGIYQNGKITGVILASFNENVVLKSLRLASIKNGYMELKQGLAVLGTLGDKMAVGHIDAKEINVANTNWTIHYQYPDSTGLGDLALLGSLIFTTSFVALLALFVGHRWLSNILRQDLESLMKAFKDIMTHNSQSNYPLELTEFTAAISNLMQFKRVLDYGDRESPAELESGVNIIVNDDDDFDIEGLFDEVNGFKL